MSFTVIEPHELFAALADPTRVRILLLVERLQLAIGELAEILGQSQPRVSRHVRLLADAGLVERRKEGAFVFVGIADGAAAPVVALINRLWGNDPAAPLLEAESRRLRQVCDARQQAIDDWFEAHAGEWDLFRKLAGQEDGIDQALAEAARRPAVGHLLDIGTGTGRLLATLASEARSATGVDRSPEMLRLARGKLADSGSQAAQLVQADMLALPFADARFDTVILQHVLHFADNPAAALRETARVMAPAGKLLVADYAAHDHEQLRTEMQHRRLGFAPESMLALMAAAGLRGELLSTHPGPELSVLIFEGQHANAA